MDDSISRRAMQEIVDRIGGMYPYRQIGNRESYSSYNEAWTDCINRVDAELNSLPSAEPEWNNHSVACLLADVFGDSCACNYNGIDEWLPEKCELLDSCPNPVGVACWEQYLKHRAERRTDNANVIT